MEASPILNTQLPKDPHLDVSETKPLLSMKENEQATEEFDSQVYSWGDLEDLALEEHNPNVTRDPEDLIKMNKILGFYYRKILEGKTELKDLEGVDGFVKIIDHLVLLNEGRFLWENLAKDVDDFNTLIKTSVSKFSHVFDFECGDHRFIQAVFPINVIDKYLSICNYDFGTQHYDKALRFQTCLSDVFLRHHLFPDTCFHLRIEGENLSVTDPFLRIKIREQNRNDKAFMMKYWNENFTLKSYVFKLMENFFPNVSWRYIGGSQEMHRTTFKTVLSMFELGLWSAEDLREFLPIFFQKLENLIVLENRTFQDFLTTLAGYPKFIVTMKEYFYELKEMVAGICGHIVTLINDISFQESHYLYNKNLSINKLDEDSSWNSAYFNNIEISAILNRILVTYLLSHRANQKKAEAPANPAEEKKEYVPVDPASNDPLTDKNKYKGLFRVLHDFLMSTTDIPNDVIVLSSNTVTQMSIDFYHSVPKESDVKQAAFYYDTLKTYVHELSCGKVDVVVEKAGNKLKNTLVTLISDIQARESGKQQEHYKHVLGMHSVPNILLTLLTLSDLPVLKKLNISSLVGFAIVELCKKNIINQVLISGESGMAHWNHLKEANRLIFTSLISEIFRDNFHLMFAHPNIFKKFVESFADYSKIVPQSKEDKWSTQLFVEGILKTHETDKELDQEFSNVITIYVICKFLCLMSRSRDANYETKFMSMRIYNTLRPIIPFALKIITEENIFKDFVSDCRFIFDGKSPIEINSLMKTSGVTFSENQIKSILLETSLMALETFAQTTQGLFGTSLYTDIMQTELRELLGKTEYLLELKSNLHQRGVILNLFTNFKIFANNSFLSMRIGNFPNPVATVGEGRIVNSHLNGDIMKEIMKELSLLTRIEKIVEFDSSIIESVQKYYYYGVFPMIYKFTKGLYQNYSLDQNLPDLISGFNLLKDKLIEISPVLKSKFNIVFTTVISGEESNGLIAALNQVLPFSKGKSQNTNNIFDIEEKLKPGLRTLRSTLQSLIEGIENVYYQDSKNEWAHDFITDLSIRLNRECPMTATKEFPEPWNPTFKNNSGANRTDISVKSNEMNHRLMDALLNKSGLTSTEFAYFKELMNLYKKKKSSIMGNSGNFFIKYLKSKDSNLQNIVMFFSKIFYRHCGDLNKKVETGQPEETRNYDYLLEQFLTDGLLYSYLNFFSKSINDCPSLREAIYDPEDKSWEDSAIDYNAGPTKFAFKACYIVMNLSFCILLGKTFHDLEFQILKERFFVLTDFFKNTCEGNYQRFKKLMNGMSPLLPGTPGMTVVAGKGGITFHLYSRYENLTSSLKHYRNKSGRPLVSDKPECFDIMTRILYVLCEFCNGPCEVNQKSIYTYKTDMFMGMIKRTIDNVDSSFYKLKIAVLDYLLSLLEGDNELLLGYYGSNLSFDIVFNLIHHFLKKLYIYSIVKNDKNKYIELAKNARKFRIETLKRKKAQEKELADLYAQGNINLYSEEKIDAVSKLSDALKMDPSEEYLDLTDCRNITEEIMDYFKIDDYTKIFDLYLSDPEFTNHDLFKITMKCNEILLKISTRIAGFKISLENIFISLMDKYEDEVPNHITSSIKTYVKSPIVGVFPERNIFYMFLIKISSKIELLVDNKIINITFPKLPHVFFLTEETKKKFLVETEPETAMVDLIKNFDDLEYEMKVNLKFHRKYKQLYRVTSEDSFYYIKLLLWLLGLLLNVLLIIFYERNYGKSWIISMGVLPIKIVALVIMAISITFLIIWFMSKYPQKVQLAKNSMEVTSSIFNNNSVSIKNYWRIYIGESFAKQSYPSIFLVHTLSSLFGLIFGPFFYTLQLLTVVFISKTTSYVVQSITTHIDQLMLTFLLAIFVMYCYSVLAAEYFWDTLTTNSPDSSSKICTQLWECLLYVVNSGLRNGGGIGDSTEPRDPYDSEPKFISKFFFDLMFFMLINVISLNIIFGIIIDTFAGMRESREEHDEKMENICLICQVERGIMERKGDSFEKHIEEDHQFWEYCYFLTYLLGIDPEEFTGLQADIHNQFIKKQLFWVPKSQYQTDEEIKQELEAKEFDNHFKIITEKLELLIGNTNPSGNHSKFAELIKKELAVVKGLAEQNAPPPPIIT